MEQIAAETLAIEEQATQGLALSPAQTDGLLLELRTRLLALVEAEAAAASLLQSAVR